MNDSQTTSAPKGDMQGLMVTSGDLLRRAAGVLAAAGFGAMIIGVLTMLDGSPRLTQVGWGLIAAGGFTFLGATRLLAARGASD